MSVAESRLRVYYQQLFPELFSNPLSLNEIKNTNHFLNIKDIQQGWKSQAKEFDYDCIIDGSIPSEISGTFYRNGPGLLEVYGTPLVHPIDGDGMVCSVSIHNGKAHFRSKYVKTKEYKAEKDQQKSLFRGMMGTNPDKGWKEALKDYLKIDNISDMPKFKNPSNTNVYYWGGKLLSCWESGLPYSLDPITLETIESDNLNGILDEANCLAAHFRYDPKEDLLITFSLRLSLSGKTKIYIHEFDRKWNLIRQQIVQMEKYYYAHDFLLTENYYIFHHTPFYDLTNENIMKFATMELAPGQTMRYYDTIPSGMVLIPRFPKQKNANEYQFFECEPFHIYHHLNAFEQNNKIIFSSVCLGKDFTMEFDNKVALYNASITPGRVILFEIDLQTNTMKWEQVDDCSCEFPTINVHQNGKPWRYAYLMATEANKPLIPYQEVIKFDREMKNRQVWSSRDEKGVIGEPVFIPRENGTTEDDGWVIVQMYECEKHHTQFVLLDAKDLTKGPIARIHLKNHIPYGFHGTWSCF